MSASINNPDQEVRRKGRGVWSALKKELLSGIGIGPKHTSLVQGKKGSQKSFIQVLTVPQ